MTTVWTLSPLYPSPPRQQGEVGSFPEYVPFSVLWSASLWDYTECEPGAQWGPLSAPCLYYGCRLELQITASSSVSSLIPLSNNPVTGSQNTDLTAVERFWQRVFRQAGPTQGPVDGKWPQCSQKHDTSALTIVVIRSSFQYSNSCSWFLRKEF